MTRVRSRLSEIGARPAGPPARWSVRAFLLCLVLASLLPLLGFSSFLVIRSASREQGAIAASARDRTRIAAAAIEDEITLLRGRLFLLAGGLSLETSDLEDFHARAREAFGGMTVVLSDAEGHEILNSSVPFGEPVPRHPDVMTLRDVVATVQPRVGDLARDPRAQAPLVTINVPINRDSRLVYVLSLDITQTLPRILRELDLPEGWIAGIFDREGYMIARSRDAERFVGSRASLPYLDRITHEDTGWIPGVSREGVPLFNSFVHTKMGGWTVNVGIPRDVLLAPVRHSTRLLILLGGVSLVLAISLAFAIGRRIAAPITGLVPAAEAVGRGESVALRPSRLTEANLVARSLYDAGVRLRRAADEREGATAALRDSEQMYRALARDLARVDEERNALLNRVVVAQENERTRVARDLHDGLAQYLTALRLKIDALDQPGRSSGAAVGDLRSLIGELDIAVHRMAWEMRPVALDELGLHTAVDHYLDEWQEMARLPVDRTIDLDGEDLPPAVAATLFRVLQEATTNVLRHAGASRVGVILRSDSDRARLIVEDDGKGFPAEAANPAAPALPGFGLPGMRERLALVHGDLEVESTPGKGTTLFISIPLGRNEQDPQRQREDP